MHRALAIAIHLFIARGEEAICWLLALFHSLFNFSLDQIFELLPHAIQVISFTDFVRLAPENKFNIAFTFL